MQFYTESLSNNINSALTEKLCTSKLNFPAGTDISPLNPDYLIRRRGEILQEFKCIPVKVTAIVNSQPHPRCFRHGMPVYLGNTLVLLDTQKKTVIDIEKRNQINCNLIYPDFVWDTNHEILLYADPTIRVETHLKILDFAMTVHEERHESVEKNLFYTQEELTKYENLMHFHQVREEIFDDFVSNLCNGQDSPCGYNSNFDQPLIKFDNLLPNIPSFAFWD